MVSNLFSSYCLRSLHCYPNTDICLQPMLGLKSDMLIQTQYPARAAEGQFIYLLYIYMRPPETAEYFSVMILDNG